MSICIFIFIIFGLGYVQGAATDCFQDNAIDGWNVEVWRRI